MTFETLPAWWRPPREETPVEGGRTQTAVRRSGFFDLWGAVDAAALAVGPVVRREDDLIAGHTELQWGEHCVECAAPACYEACDLFIPSESGCRRFLHGIGRTDHHATLRDWSYEIVFLPWGNLLAKIGRPLAGFDGFLLQVHNPGPAALTAVVDFRGPSGPNRRRLMWQERLPPGASQFFYPLDRLEAAIGHDGVTEVAIAVDSTAPTTTVVFPFAEFVRWKESAPDAIDAGRVKCVAVDLDNTLWRGTLVEDGAEAVTLDQTMLKQLALLRDRGIVTSIVSKNDAEEAGSVLKRLGIRDQFVFPEIDWGAKSQSVARLAESLGIGIDSIALIDDSSYERAEVQAAQPEVQVLKPSELGFLVRRISRGTRGGLGERRFEFYRDEESRRAARDAVSDHDEFLRSLGTEARISAPAAADVGRVQELVQRTNRLNFSGHRYSRAEIEALLRDPTLRCRTVCARDRFGDYGLVGFLVLGTADPRSWSIRDLMFSCRILGRQVDVFTLVQTIEEARSAGVESLLATFRPSGRNDSARAALETAGFNPRDEESWGFDPQQSEVPRIDTVTAWRDADDRSGAST
jgi:FkbH-like protein